MIEQASRIAREFHIGPLGDRYALSRDPKSGQPYVLHRPGQKLPEVQLDLGSFLVLFRGQEREDLLQLIASLLPEEQALDRDETNVVQPIRFIERCANERNAETLMAFAHNPNGSRFPCRIQNISDGTATLEFLGSHIVKLENSFDIMLVNSEVRYCVKLVWRSKRTAGVLFCD